MVHRKLSTLFCITLLPLLIMGELLPCLQLVAREPPSVISDLRPSDVKIVLGMGDSITTAFGMHNGANESRGYSFSMGGDNGAITLPNLLKNFNPNVVGSSIGSSVTGVCYGTNCVGFEYHPEQDGNNAAKSGALVTDLSGVQAEYLIRQVNHDPNMDVNNDWKVLSIMIGMDDLCASCEFYVAYLSPDEFEINLIGTLERIRTSLPRTFVNLVAGLNVSAVYNLSLQRSDCANVQRDYFVQCDCVFNPTAQQTREDMDILITEFNQRAAKVASYYSMKSYPDFGVAYQPFLSGTRSSDLTKEFLAPDCFHPSAVGQKAMAIALWNSMLTPAQNKQESINMQDVPLCPDANTVLYTS